MLRSLKPHNTEPTMPQATARDWLARLHPPALAPWAIGPERSGGREYPEPEHPYRTCFQRDRDRIVHCSAFRRLDFKTQVYVPHECDHFRTRLTHTLEVAQIGRTLGRALGLCEDLVETVALAHDLGHPPFGHGGEAALDNLMTEHGRFEHNRQSLRVVDYLEHPYPHFRGLNLTRVVRVCLAKHETRYDTPLPGGLDEPGMAPLAGQLVDRSDEIAYTSADLEDSLVAESITVEQVEHLALWQRAWRAAEEAAPGASAMHNRIRACKNVLAAMADDLLNTTVAVIDSLGVRGPEDVRDASRRCVDFSPGMARDIEQMQNFLLNNVYLSERHVEHDQRGRRIIRELFNAFVADPALLPERYRRRIEFDGLCRVTCDFIAGMTDRYCEQEHARLFG